MTPDLYEKNKTKSPNKNFLIGQLGSYGDCLYATAVARQIKTDYPDCKLTWAIGSTYINVLDGNPYIDDIWVIPLNSRDDLHSKWEEFESEAINRKMRGEFDEIFLTQVFPNNVKNFDGTLRSSIFRAYPNPITVPVSPVIMLSENEIKNVKKFADLHNLKRYKDIILFECSSKSDQSFVTWNFAYEVTKELVRNHTDLCVILSSNDSFKSDNEQIIDGSVLSFRENAELSKYCTLIIGCSSGISWLCTSTWAKPLPMIQLLKSDKAMYASFQYDHEYHGLNSEFLIEMTDCSTKVLINCVETIISDNFDLAKKKYHEKIKLNFYFYATALSVDLLQKGKYKDALTSLKYTIKRYGPNPKIMLGIIFVLKDSQWVRSKWPF